jgi:uncharacterized membrane protein YeaQ/YmgE (transglycosylase-associated protein family)
VTDADKQTVAVWLRCQLIQISIWRYKMNILVWIIFGALAGWLASIVMGTNRQMGALANIIVGIIGAFLGGLIMNAFGAAGVTGFNLNSILVAVLGAVALLFVVRLVRT